jgi:lycopene elongase/hydratase (dihydrobisanhydrobacterioruberin-forming)
MSPSRTSGSRVASSRLEATRLAKEPRSKSNRLVQVLRFVRVSDWFYFEGFAVLGFLMAIREGAPLSVPTALASIVGCGFALAYAYSLNNCFDVDIDRRTGLRTVLTEGELSRRTALSISLALLALSLLVTALLTRQSMEYSLLFAVLWTAYSVPPVRFKSRPILGTLTNGVGFGLLFLMGYSALGAVGAVAFLFFGFLALIEIPSQLFHEMAHHAGDGMSGAWTTAVRFGTRASALVGAISTVAAASIVAAMAAMGQLSLWYVAVVWAFAAVCLGLIYRHLEFGGTADDATKVRMFFKWGGMLVGAVFAVLLWLGV